MAAAAGDGAKPLVPFVAGPEDEDMGIGNVSAYLIFCESQCLIAICSLVQHHSIEYIK